jgi:ribosomal protein S18 acetylase RimI-like enzyme
MAAVPKAQIPTLVDLWRVGVDEMQPMLEDEIQTWREELDWDFRASADLVRRFIDVHALNGFALLVGGESVGYAYYVREEHKGLIGDLYLREEYRQPEYEYQLLGALISQLTETRGVRRIESQLMLAEPSVKRVLPSSAYARSYKRNFMMYDLSGAAALAEHAVDGVVFDGWTERRQDETAYLIAAAYRHHIDSEINDQYRSAEGARRFLYNIVQHPGCGTFFPQATWVALDRGTGRMCGVSLTSMVAEKVGHVTQICTSPAVRGKGAGYELLRRSLDALARAGAGRASLTVTTANENAVRLYESVGFTTLKHFPAFVWDGL